MQHYFSLIACAMQKYLETALANSKQRDRHSANYEILQALSSQASLMQYTASRKLLRCEARVCEACLILLSVKYQSICVVAIGKTQKYIILGGKIGKKNLGENRQKKFTRRGNNAPPASERYPGWLPGAATFAAICISGDRRKFYMKGPARMSLAGALPGRTANQRIFE